MANEIEPLDISSTFVVMNAEGSAVPVPVGDNFYEELDRNFGDFKDKRLVSHHRFDQDWDSWEMHPAGEEFVCLLSGRVDFVLEQDGVENVAALTIAGAYVIVPQGVWHTAKVHQPSSVLFITPGEGTQHRAV
ncbi:hypothetical protein VB780_09280 [Leptolyngbya sp. CCNP1308]|uniref:hypothetical protein n=1 Tax=Leptolyngbya sp. CCNP1308 TaxID=3110255 RepID=UPI002B1F7AE9|nr:hypothetical protein [Leptolyngbya sp. CCNP1308]MEA5448757.1 hypothetical protein [Leptolyngbya sp. CCNP1308]